jgi:hypothetical protein
VEVRSNSALPGRERSASRSPLRKEPHISIRWEGGWTPDLDLTCRKERTPAP